MNTVTTSRDIREMRKKIANHSFDTSDDFNNDISINYVIKRFIEIMLPFSDDRAN